MTDEERKRLVADLHEVALMWGGGSKPRNTCLTAAEEIKRLAALAQSDAEPIGIDLDDVDKAYDKWAEHRDGHSRLDAFRVGVEFGLRYTAPPRPDASAGLIEAAEIAEALAETGPDYDGESPPYYNGFSDGAEVVAKALRARAADAQSNAEPDVTRAARLLGEYAQANGYDRFTWKMAVKTPGEEQERYRVEAVSEAALAQSDAEPVAWRWRFKRRSWSDWVLTDKRPTTDYEDAPPYEIHALYTAPPRPDASVGLIEAAEHLTASADQIKKQAESLLGVGTDEWCKEQATELAIIEPCLRAEANYLRARATDRSTK